MEEAALKQVKLFVVLIQADLYSKFPDSTGLLCKLSALPVHIQLEGCWAAQIPGVVSSPTGQMGLENALHSGWGYVSDPLPRLEGESPL